MSTSAERWSDHRESGFPRLLAWGLRKYFWVVLLGVMIGALALPSYRYAQPDKYDSSALVVASELRTVLTAVPRYATAVFDNGSVAEAVIDEYGSSGDPEDVVPNKVSLVAPQDSIVMEVWGHADDPDEAAGIANVAAEEFVSELNTSGPGVGVFQVQSPAEAPVEAEEPFRAAPYSVVLGATGGLLLSIGAVLLILALRRPVLAGTGEVHGIPVSGVMLVPRRGTGRPPFPGTTAVLRSLFADAATRIFVASSAADSIRRSQAVASLEALERQAASLRAGEDDAGALMPRIQELESLESPLLAGYRLGQRVLVVVVEGTPSADASRLVEGLSSHDSSVLIVRPMRSRAVAQRSGNGTGDEQQRPNTRHRLTNSG